MRIAKLIVVSAGLLGLASPAAATLENPRDSEANMAFTAYPKESLDRGEQGIVHYRVKIGSGGRPTRCEITRSSGYYRLDSATCDLLMGNARFTPARDGRGRRTRSVYDGRVVWKIS